MRGRLGLVLLVACAVAAATWLVGWWGVAVVGAAAGIWRGAGWPVALGAPLGWSLLLILDALGGRLSAVAGTVGAIMQVPGIALVGITLVFAALLAWAAATVSSGIANLALGRRAATHPVD